MEIKHIAASYHVSPQIGPDDMAELARQGFSTVICNRPDAEVPAELSAAAMAKAAKDAGIAFVPLPLTHQTMTAEASAAQSCAISEAPQKVLAYCASGTRSTVIWALGQVASGADVGETLAAARAAGYDLEGMRPTLDALARGG